MIMGSMQRRLFLERLAALTLMTLLTVSLPASAQRLSYGLGFIGFNTTQPPFNNVLTRRAVAHATPRTSLAQAATGVMPAFGIVPPQCVEGSSVIGSVRLHLHDVEAAKQLLESSGIKPSETPELTFWEQEGLNSAAIVSEIRELGLRVSLRKGSDASAVRSPSVNIFYLSVLTNACTDATPAAIFAAPVRSLLELLIHSKGTMNVFGYANPDVDSLIDRARRLLDRPQSVADIYAGFRLLQEAEQKALDEAVLIPIWWRCPTPSCRRS